MPCFANLRREREPFTLAHVVLFSNKTILDRQNDIFYKHFGQNLGLSNFHLLT